MARVAMKVMIILITIAAPVDKVVEISSMEKVNKLIGYQPLTKALLTFKYTHDCLRLNTPDTSISASDGVGSSQ